MVQVYETIVYVNFYLAGDYIFSCQRAWLPNMGDIELKCADLADIHQVKTSLITWEEKPLKLPIILPKELTTDLGVLLSKNE